MKKKKRLERKGRYFRKRREICIGKRKRSQKISLYSIQFWGNEKEEEIREKKSYGKKIMGKGSRNN